MKTVRRLVLATIGGSGLLLVACGDDASDDPMGGAADAAAPASSSPRASSAPSASAQPPREGPEGCYFTESHTCDCSIAEADCDEAFGTWTSGCNSCGPAADAAPAMDAATGADASDAEVAPSSYFGCYDTASHVCDCEQTEAVCMTQGDVWTDQCECGAVSSGPDAAVLSDAAASADASTSADAGASDSSLDAAPESDTGTGIADPPDAAGN